MTATESTPAAPAEAADDGPAEGKPEAPITARRLSLMGQIMSRLEKPELTTGDKIWIRDTLNAQIEDEL